MSSRLVAWMNGERVGTWTVHRGSHRFRYDAAWLDSPHHRPLSLSLPITPALEIRDVTVANYFENLLPDNERIRERLARRFGTRSTGAFALLEAIGRDCVGAVQLLPDGAEPTGWDRIESEPLSEARVAGLLRAVPSERILGQREDGDLFRISIAGAQEKTALLLRDGAWHRPQGATPTTHIVKLPLGIVGGSRRVDLGDSVANEWLCARILHELGLAVAPTEMWRFEDQQVLVVTRFDRARRPRPGAGEWIARLPQEDLCQAMGVPPDRKYEKDGGPGMAACMELLAGGDAGDRESFARAQLAFWLMAATDGHAKNFSIFLKPGRHYAATPLYDVLSVFPSVGEGANQISWPRAGLAMALRAKNAHHVLQSIQTRHWHELATRYGGERLWSRMIELVESAEATMDRVATALPPDFPEATWQAIDGGVRLQARRFLSGLRDG